MLLGERVPAWAMPLWLAMVALERWLPWAGRPPCSWPPEALAGHACRASPTRPGAGSPVGSVAERLGRGDSAVHRVLPALVVGRTTPGCGR